MEIEAITARLQRMTATTCTNQNHKAYQKSRKVAEIVMAVYSGRSAPSRLKTADKILTEEGF